MHAGCLPADPSLDLCGGSRHPRLQLAQRVAAEPLGERLGEHERHHGFADDGGGRHGADITALDGRRRFLDRLVRSTERSGFISVEMGFM